jgi:hypothetical protein
VAPQSENIAATATAGSSLVIVVCIFIAWFLSFGFWDAFPSCDICPAYLSFCAGISVLPSDKAEMPLKTRHDCAVSGDYGVARKPSVNPPTIWP